MRIGIDAAWACGERTGTGVMCLDLVRGLVEAAAAHSLVLYVRSCCVQRNPLCALGSDRVEIRVVEAATVVARALFKLGPALRRDRVDVFISPAFFLPLSAPCRTIVTFLDLNIYTLPGTWLRHGRWRNWLVMRLVFPLSLRRADHVVAISRATLHDLVRLFSRVGPRASVIPPPFSPARLVAADGGRTAASRLAGDGPYFLYVGELSPAKNLERLLRAFARLRAGAAGPRLVLAGRDCAGHADHALRPLIRELGLSDAVTLTGFVDDAALAALYRHALAVVFPSLREGFGYPILEGMAAGVPVLTSDTTACAETAGDAALLVDPLSVDAIADGLGRLAADADLRERLVAAGRARVAQFSRAEVARRYVALAEQLHAGEAPGT